MAIGPRLRVVLSLLRNLAFAALLYTATWATIHLAADPSARHHARQKLPSVLGHLAVPGTTDHEVKLTFEGIARTVSINPHANVFNRPPNAVQPKDDYLGKRPHVDTVADLPMLVEECRGTYDGLEKMRNVYDCLKFMSEREDKYLSLPELSHRASEQEPAQAEYLDSDGHNNTLAKYPTIKSAKSPSKSTMGTCPGPIIPYHVYWAGPATWRLEIFIKAYLYTQNLPCSRLWLWLDADKSPVAVDRMLNRDPLFARFLPLVERGDIKVMAWNFPTRIPLPPKMDHTDGFPYGGRGESVNAFGERHLSESVIIDANDQQWLTLTPKQMTFSPRPFQMLFASSSSTSTAVFTWTWMSLCFETSAPSYCQRTTLLQSDGLHTHILETTTLPSCHSLQTLALLLTCYAAVCVWLLTFTLASSAAWLGRTSATMSC